VVLWQYTPRQPKIWNNLCDDNGYLYDMAVYLEKQLMNAALNITPTHGRVMQLTREVKDLDTTVQGFLSSITSIVF